MVSAQEQELQVYLNTHANCQWVRVHVKGSDNFSIGIASFPVDQHHLVGVALTLSGARCRVLTANCEAEEGFGLGKVS